MVQLLQVWIQQQKDVLVGLSRRYSMNCYETLQLQQICFKIAILETCVSEFMRFMQIVHHGYEADISIGATAIV